MNFDNIQKPHIHYLYRASVRDFKKCGENSIIDESASFMNSRNIILGDSIYIGAYASIKAYYKNIIEIEDGTWIGENCLFNGYGGIKIGKCVGIGPKVTILTSVHNDSNKDIPVLHGNLESLPVLIEDGSDIGVGSIILPGITIGEGSIVGAGSIVTKNVEPYTVVAGSPARFLRDRK